MWPYFVLIGVPALISLISILLHKGKVVNQPYTVAAFFFIWLVMLVLRSKECGTDLEVYERCFQDIVKGGAMGAFLQMEGFEPGYVVLSYLVSLFSDDYWTMMIIIAVVSVVPLFVFYHKRSLIPFMTVALFIGLAPFEMYFSGMRQVLAMSLAVPLYVLARKKKWFPFLLLVALGYTFHHSALIMVFFYPLCNLRLKGKPSLFFMIAAVAFSFAMKNVLLNMFTTLFSDSYGNYSGDEGGSIRMFLIYIVLLVLSFSIPDSRKLDDETIALRNFLAFAVVLQTVASVSTIAMRLNYYFILFVPLAIEKMVALSTERMKKISTALVLGLDVILCAYFFVKAYTGDDWMSVFPYEFIWD